MTKKKRYKKPVLTAIKLDPRQSIITQCNIGQTGWITGPFCLIPGDFGTGYCNGPVRGRQRGGLFQWQYEGALESPPS